MLREAFTSFQEITTEERSEALPFFLLSLIPKTCERASEIAEQQDNFDPEHFDKVNQSYCRMKTKHPI